MQPHPQFPHLFSPIEIKGVTLRNRIAVTAHSAGWWRDERGLPNEAYRAYVEERAKGGVGLFVIGATATRYDGGPTWILNVDDRIIPRYRALADAGHRHGCAVFAQLIYRSVPAQPGAQLAGVLPAPPRAPTAPPERVEVPPPPHTAEDLQQLVETFGQAAARARAGGVDGLELHAHEGHFHAQFLSPRWNNRTDEYGGPLQNRARLLVETLQAMRAAIGLSVPLGVRLKADDLVPGGVDAQDYLTFVQDLERMGLVDYFSFTGGDYAFHHGPMYRPDGEWLPLIAQFRERTQLPVMHAGRITDPLAAERAIAGGQVDIVGMTKTHIADPHFTRKAFAGQLDDIRYCMRCLQSCIGNTLHMTCVYNPVTSRERKWAELEPAARPRRVVVVGAGPAGMEAALVAAQRGHRVVVLERTHLVGGQVRAAAGSPLRRMFGEIAAFYERQVRKGAVDVRFGTDADAETVLAFEPEAVVVATGSTPVRVHVPAADCTGGRPATTVLEALSLAGAAVPRRALVVDREGHMRAFVVADFLAELGMEVEFVTPLAEPGPALDAMNRGELYERLVGRGVRFSPGQDILWWQDASTVITHDVFTSERGVRSGIDLLVVAAGSEPAGSLAVALAARDSRLEIHVVGDSCMPRTVTEATYQGGRVGRLL